MKTSRLGFSLSAAILFVSSATWACDPPSMKWEGAQKSLNGMKVVADAKRGWTFEIDKGQGEKDMVYFNEKGEVCYLQHDPQSKDDPKCGKDLEQDFQNADHAKPITTTIQQGTGQPPKDVKAAITVLTGKDCNSDNQPGDQEKKCILIYPYDDQGIDKSNAVRVVQNANNTMDVQAMNTRAGCPTADLTLKSAEAIGGKKGKNTPPSAPDQCNAKEITMSGRASMSRNGGSLNFTNQDPADKKANVCNRQGAGEDHRMLNPTDAAQ